MAIRERTEWQRKYRKTKEGVISQIYGAQNQRSKKRGHLMPSYSKEWLSEWILSNDEFHILYEKWVLSGYDKWLKPSVDRIDDSIGYTTANIQLMTWFSNKAKSHTDVRSGKSPHGHNQHIPTLQLSKDGCLIREFISSREASRATNIDSGNISKCCNGKVMTAGGYVWRYKDD